MAEMVAEHRLAGGAHRKALFQRVTAAGRDPGDLGGEAVDQLALLLQQALGDEHRHCHVLMAGGLKAGVQVFLDVLPDGVAIGTQHHETLDAGILDQLGLGADIGDRFDHFFLIVCHFLLILTQILNLSAAAAPQALHTVFQVIYHVTDGVEILDILVGDLNAELVG